MGNGSNSSTKTDLFSAQQSPDTSSPSASEPKSSPLRTDEPAAASSPSYALPTNLPSALRHLDDDQLERLLAAVLAELLRFAPLPSAYRARLLMDRSDDLISLRRFKVFPSLAGLV